MGSNAIQLLKEDLCCPVCKNPLSSPGSLPNKKSNKTHKFGRGKGFAPHLHTNMLADKNRRVAVAKFKDHEEIVVARCGHLFHRFCLRHFCFLYREGRSNPMCRVTCPTCQEHISMLASHPIDYKVHQGKISNADKDFTKTELMNTELGGQKDCVKRKLRKVADAIEDGLHNLQIYRSHRRKIKQELRQAKLAARDIDDLYGEIDHADKMLAYMQTHHLKIVRKFICKAQQKSANEFVHLPRRLAPYLHIIEEDDRLVRNLGEIIVPIQVNHLKSDRKSLLCDILTIVNDKLASERINTEFLQNQEQSIPEPVLNSCSESQMNPMPPVIVKVGKSSVSIMSSQSLSQESIKMIMNTVKDPMKIMRNACKASKQHKNVDKKISDNFVDNVSASDIKIIYMPKRKMIEQVSEQCRIMNESESLLANVPVRKCKSTDAVLMKSRRKRLQVVDAQSNHKLKNKRSNSITAISVSKRPLANSTNVNSDFAPEKRNGRPEVTSNQPSETCYEKNQPVAIVDSPAISTETGHERNYQNIYKPKNIDDPNDIIETVPHCYEDREQSNEGDTSAIPQAVSLLEVIYDNLKEERQSHQNLVSRTRFPALDENQNILSENYLSDFSNLPTSHTSISNTFNNFTPRPQFYRVDGKGIVRPESPHAVSFRQPTFLAPHTDFNIEKYSNESAFCFEPDEENQLEALSSDERILIASEQEKASIISPISARRPMFHGVPACLGMPNGQFTYQTPPDIRHVPFYLKKWQEQLPSRKVLKAIPRRMAMATNVLRSTRFSPRPHLPSKRERDLIFRHDEMPPPNTEMKNCRGLNSEIKKDLATIPLSLFPVKRPSTAVCKIMENPFHVEGPDSLLCKIYSTLNN